jgi:hypothetical protein
LREGFLSGWQDSNLRSPAPKAGAMTGLRHTPNLYSGLSLLKSGGKNRHFFGFTNEKLTAV